MTSAAPTILALETDSSWVVIVAVSVVTLPLALLLRRLIARPGGLASGVFLSLPLVVPLVAAAAFEHAVLPEVSLLRPAGPSLFGRSGDLLHLLLVPTGKSRLVMPYALVGSAGPWLLLIGISVSAFMMIRRGLGAATVHRLVRRCTKLTDPGVEGMVARLAMDAGLERTPPILVLPDGMHGAFAVGGRRGRILVAGNLVAELDRDELEGIIAHEIAHLKARDVQLVFTAGLLRDLVAWNPVAHVAYRRLLADREIEADRRAAAMTGSPLAVASGLLKVCEMSKRTPRAQRRLALGFFNRRGRVARRVGRLIRLSDSHGALAVDNVGRVPYVAAACLVAVVGLQAGARIAHLGNGAVAIMWGTPAASDARVWHPEADLPPKGWIKTWEAHHPKLGVEDGLARLREDPAVLPRIGVRKSDVVAYLRHIRRLTLDARHIGIPTLDLDEQDWNAVPIPLPHGPLPNLAWLQPDS